jgi:hypothetical protein
VTANASPGRTICLVLGVLSLMASFGPLFGDVSAPGAASNGAAVDEMCGAATNPNEEIGPGCGEALQAHALSGILPAIAGVAWMLGAIAFGLGHRQRAAVVPQPMAVPGPPHPAAPPMGPWPGPGPAWPQAR